MKNGFSKFQNGLITEVKDAMKEGATLLACSVLIGVKHDVSAEYVRDTFTSYEKMMVVA